MKLRFIYEQKPSCLDILAHIVTNYKKDILGCLLHLTEWSVLGERYSYRRI